MSLRRSKVRGTLVVACDVQPEPAISVDTSRLPAALVRSQLQRIIHSHTFSRFGRHKRFLTLLVEEALAGADAVSEDSVAALVCDREQCFDSRHDPIVRVYTRQLQRRLRHYYAGEGAADGILIAVANSRLIARVVSRRGTVRGKRR